jgi:hypothetical protein
VGGGAAERAARLAVSPTLYPNHPSYVPPLDANEILATDAEVGTLFHQYGKVLERAFYRASWEGVEAQNGVSIPRISSSLLIHAAPNVTLQNQASWDQFLQQKNLLSEHAFRRWVAQMKIVPDLVAHKQITMVSRWSATHCSNISHISLSTTV